MSESEKPEASSATATATATEPGLRQTISVWRGLALAVSMVVGSGLLGLPGLALAEGPATAAAGWMFSILAVVPLIYVFARLGLRYTSAAGLSRYAQEAVGPWAGHAVTAVLCGTFTVGIPALALIGAAYLQRLLGLSESSISWLAIAILAAVTLANVVGVRLASVVNTVSLVALIGMVVFLVIRNLPAVGAGVERFGASLGGQLDTSYVAVWGVCALLFWAFLGWENMSFGLEEFKNPRWSIPMVYWSSFGVVSLLYLALGVMSVGAVILGNNVDGPAGVASLVGDGWFGSALIAIMVLVILANANAWVFGASRLIYSAGDQRILPSALGRLSRTGIPRVSLLVLLAGYTVLILVIHVSGTSVSTPILVVSQNFLVLYVFSIVAFWRSERGARRWIVTPICVLSCGFLLSGFTWWIAYPVGLIIVGYIAYRRRQQTGAGKPSNDNNDDQDSKDEEEEACAQPN